VEHVSVRPSMQTEADGKRWYALNGTRLYAIATLDGRFPDLGWHQPGEMGGIWAPPIKLLDGYWLGMCVPAPPADAPLEDRVDSVVWLTTPITWSVAPEGVTLSYRLPTLGLQVTRREWVVPTESALVIEVSIDYLEGGAETRAESAPCEPLEVLCGFFVRSDLHAAWMADERLGWHDGEDLATYDEELAAVVLRDALHPAWTACAGATVGPDACQTGDHIWGPERTGGRGTGAALWYRCRVTSAGPAHLSLLITGPARDTGSATDLFARLTHGGNASGGLTPALVEAHRRAGEAFRAPFERCVLDSPDLAFNEVFAWAKANTARLLLEVPGIGTGVMAGLPDFPWWFGCDTAYGVLPMLPAGQTAAAIASLRTLATIGERCDAHGAVPHEVLPYGQIWASGNLVESPLFVRALYHTYCWTGDRGLLAELFPFCLRAIQRWLLGSGHSLGELVPCGTSIVETPEMAADLATLDVAAYLVEALDCLGELAEELPDVRESGLGQELRDHAAQIRAHVRDAWWLPQERLFGDVYASPAQLRALLADLLGRASQAESGSDARKALLTSASLLRRALESHERQPGAGETQAQPRPWLLHHMVQALAADAGLPSREQAEQLLARLETPEWRGPFGVVLNAATNQQIMTLPSGALAAGEARYARSDQALDWMQRMASAFGAASPGTLSEYAPAEGCFLQLWSSYGIIWPVVHYFFGLRPAVAARRLLCVPQLPTTWPRAALRDIPLGSAHVDVELSARPSGLRVCLQTSEPGWELVPGVALPPERRIVQARLNDQPVELSPVRLTGFEGRTTWVAPAIQGTTSYEFIITWSIDSPAV
jgi:hypothetical protein